MSKQPLHWTSSPYHEWWLPPMFGDRIILQLTLQTLHQSHWRPKYSLNLNSKERTVECFTKYRRLYVKFIGLKTKVNKNTNAWINCVCDYHESLFKMFIFVCSLLYIRYLTKEEILIGTHLSMYLLYFGNAATEYWKISKF